VRFKQNAIHQVGYHVMGEGSDFRHQLFNGHAHDAEYGGLAADGKSVDDRTGADGFWCVGTKYN